MRRSIPILTLTALLFAVLSGVASAKGVTGASISGPGGPGDSNLHIDLDQDQAMHTGELTGLFDGAWSDEERPTKAELGPRYVFTVEFDVDGDTISMTQHIYPYADDRPWVFTPAQEFLDGSPLEGGWAQAYDALRLDLVDYGLPSSNPLADAADAATRNAPIADDGTSAIPWIVLASIAGLLGIAAIAGRLRRTHTA